MAFKSVLAPRELHLAEIVVVQVHTSVHLLGITRIISLPLKRYVVLLVCDVGTRTPIILTADLPNLADADCAATVKVVPACADSSWGLYHAIAEFCCPVDYVGVYPEGGTGLMCLSSSLPIPSDKLAGSVKQNTSTKAAAATPSPGSKTTSASSGTVTSGAVTSDAVSSDTATSDQNSQSPTGTTGNSTKSGGLSKNATIAIAVLATALGLLSIFIIGYCLWRRKRRSTRQSQSSADPPNTQSTNAYAHSSTTEKIPAAQPATAKPGEVHVNELLGKNVLYPPGTTELETSHRAELYDTGRVQ
ncbi:hypothetical protein ONS96_002265 [Cadophora gregata f. sp. sojae]|nr:hypothetical protein ONS96_002265 [Cadophora gregata f. sp. sojae]